VFFIYKKSKLNIITGVMVPNATFNNISVLSRRSVLLVEGTGVPGENHRPPLYLWTVVSVGWSYKNPSQHFGVVQKRCHHLIEK
jgi:hypothetical protein